jgi:hypothetical protein
LTKILRSTLNVWRKKQSQLQHDMWGRQLAKQRFEIKMTLCCFFHLITVLGAATQSFALNTVE